MAADELFRWLGFDHVAGEGFKSKCSCGWVSEVVASGALAGAVFMAHAAGLLDHMQAEEI
jgi:hypothetical protein